MDFFINNLRVHGAHSKIAVLILILAKTEVMEAVFDGIDEKRDVLDHSKHKH